MAADLPSSPQIDNKRRSIAIVWLTVFIDLVGFSIIFPLFPTMLDWYLPRGDSGGLLAGLVEMLRGVTPEANQDFLITVLFGGILGSLYSLIQFIAAPVWGRLSDRHGRRAILLWTTSGTALAYLVWIFSGSFWLLIVSRLLGGLMAGNISVATAAVADITTAKERSKGMALIGLAFGLGFILGPAIGGLGSMVQLPFNATGTATFALTPFSFPALLAFGLALVNVVWVWRAFPETHQPQPAAVPSQGTRPVLSGRLFTIGSRNADVRVGLRVYLLFIFAFAGMEFTLTFLALERLLYQPHEMVKMFVFVGITMAFTQGILVRRCVGVWIHERNAITLGLLIAFIGLLQLAVGMQTIPFYIGLFLLGTGVGIVTPCITGLVSQYTPREFQGAELGALRATGALGRALGPLFGAITFWWLGSYTAYMIGATVIALAAFVSLFLPKPRFSGSPVG